MHASVLPCCSSPGSLIARSNTTKLKDLQVRTMSDRTAEDKAREKDADKMVKEAKSLCGPSFFGLRFKPDWENASPLLEKAALAYKVQ